MDNERFIFDEPEKGSESEARFGQIRDFDDLESLYDYASKNGLIPPNMQLKQFLKRAVAEKTNYKSYLDDSLDREILSTHPTFGTDEPTYLELLGEDEILRLQGLEQGNFLLLGSYGKWSAEEFRDYTRKINPKIKPYVVDIDDRSIESLKKLDQINTVQADALELPFQNSTFENIYTNQLFFFLSMETKTDGKFSFPLQDVAQLDRMVKSKLDLLFKEAYRVLKPGGSFVPVERSYGLWAGALEATQSDPEHVLSIIHGMEAEMDGAAKNAGFKSYDLIEERIVHHLRKYLGSAEIDTSGIAHYKYPIAKLTKTQGIGFRFTK